MESSGLLFLLVAVVIIVIVIAVLAMWPAQPVDNTQSVAPSPSKDNSQVSGSLQDLNRRLGEAMFRLIDALETEAYQAIRSEVDSLIEKISTKVCRSKNRQDLANLYQEQVNLIVECCKAKNDHEFKNSVFSTSADKTPTGTHSPASASGCEVNSNLARIQALLTVNVAGIASVMSECTGTSTKSLEQLLGTCVGTLIKYNTIKNIEGRKTQAKNFENKYLPLWEKLRSQ